MRKTCKTHMSKRAFTLLEMVMVIAIIVILASARMIGVTGYIEGTKKAKNQVDAQADEVSHGVHASEEYLADFGY